MTSITEGDIVEIVLDVVHVSDVIEGHEYERVLVQGAFPRGAQRPDPVPGGQRNVVQVFFGRDMRNVRAFLIETALTASEAAT